MDVAHDSVSLFTESFDTNAADSVYNPHADLSSNNWTSGNSVANEVVAYRLNNVNGNDGFWFDTQGSQGGIDLKNSFDPLLTAGRVR